ncbi:uncharacterized protein LOC105734810 isoform X2 [Apis florea]|uniref:uncharacterized protein LOC105734810 isoform X2 n=1 Tax=Apis florea TaxID=7463 RepID=UPI0012FF0807|nr:uncharacterized protein LOC105734810 isoform X2 [Apis florea]
MTRSGGRATPHGVYIHQSTETEWSMLAWHCHTNMTPGSNGIQYWFEICNQIDGKFPMNRDNIIYIYGEDGDIRMTDANMERTRQRSVRIGERNAFEACNPFIFPVIDRSPISPCYTRTLLFVEMFPAHCNRMEYAKWK